MRIERFWLWIGSLCITAGVIASCDSQLPPNQFSQADAEEIALRIVPGSTLLQSYDSSYRRTAAWYLIVSPPNGSQVVVVLQKTTGELLRIFGNVPPFDYEVEPGLLLLPYSITRDTALRLRPGTLHRWELQRPPLIPRWEYDFIIDVPDTVHQDSLRRWLVAIDAETGFPISLTQLP